MLIGWRARPVRAVVLAAGVVVAAVAFTLLTAATRTSELHVRGTVTKNFRSSYDILVRPRGARDSLEQSSGLVRDNYLSGIYGGITLAQWRTIKSLSGVEVAAPVANIGYAFPEETEWLSLKSVLDDAPHQIYRVSTTWVTNDGSRYPGDVDYVYYTRAGRLVLETRWGILSEVDPGKPGYTMPCSGFPIPFQASGPFDPGIRSELSCFAHDDPTNTFNLTPAEPLSPPGFVGAQISAAFPTAVAAIDPASEARLLHLDRTLVAGRYLRPTDTLHTETGKTTFTLPLPLVPVIASERTYIGERQEIDIERLRLPPDVDVPRALESSACTTGNIPCPQSVPSPKGASFSNGREFLNSLSGRTVQRRTVPVESFYEQLLAGSARSGGHGVISPSGIWTASAVRYRRLARDHLRPVAVRNSPQVWRWDGGPAGYLAAPTDNADTQYRKLREHVEQNTSSSGAATPELQVVGRFDPTKLPGFSPLSRVPLETFYPPVLTAADAASAEALKGRDYLPTQNLGGYVAQPPLLLTTLKALQEYFLNPKYFQGVPAAVRRAPISIVQVRVKGVTGPNAVGEARIRLVAQEIHDRTGLDVDVTAGSSPHPLKISLPKGKFGAPALLLWEGWSKKNASISFLNALDRKDLGLFALILLICGFFLANGALAAARARRVEIGTLLTVGWSRRQVFVAVLGELALVGLIAGAAGTAIAALLVSSLSLSLPLAETVLVLPIAVALAVLAGAVPAWLAARGAPLDALRPVVAGGGGSRSVRSLGGMALVNMLRVPSRSVIGGAGLALAVAALTVLAGIERAFHGAVVGTLLGDAISLQVRSADFVALGLAAALAALSVGDVLYLNLRERQAELVTLRTVGWSDNQIRQTIGLEALLLGTCAGCLGALAGALVTALVLGAGTTPVVTVAVIAAVAGTAVAVLASLVPVYQVERLAAPAVLAAE
ncbi:MAG TPA: ABC transporter permease [Gaiellaceae bacterium]